MDDLIFANSDIINDVLRLVEEEKGMFELPKRREPIYEAEIEIKSPFTCVFWSHVWQHWIGVHRIQKGYVFSFNDRKDQGLTCAKLLNSLCLRNKITPLPNPDINIEEPTQNEWTKTKFSQVYHHELSGFYASVYRGITASSRHHNAQFVASRLNARCKKENKDIPNINILCEFNSTDYHNIYYLPTLRQWIGQISGPQGVCLQCTNISTAQQCAIQLNEECVKSQWQLANSNLSEDSELIGTVYPGIFSDSQNKIYIGIISEYKIEIQTFEGSKECAVLMNQDCHQRDLKLFHPTLPTKIIRGSKAPIIQLYIDLLGQNRYLKQYIPFRQTNAFDLIKANKEIILKKSKRFERLPINVSKDLTCINQNVFSKKQLQIQLEKKKSKYKGVYWETRDQKWRARIYCGGKRLSGGSHISESEAGLAVNRLCRQLRMRMKNPHLENITEDGFVKIESCRYPDDISIPE